MMLDHQRTSCDAVASETFERVLRFLGLPVDLRQIRSLSAQTRVADATAKYIVSSDAGERVAFLVIAPKAFPEAAATAAARALEVRELLGPDAGSPVVAPLYFDTIEGTSFALFPYHRKLNRVYAWRLWGYAPLQRAVMEWLLLISQRTLSQPGRAELGVSYVDPLRLMSEHASLSTPIRRAAELALGKLVAGQWNPLVVASHNDFWVGNLLQPSSRQPSRFRFAVVDWGGSLVRGHPIYDLVRMAISLRMPAPLFQAQLLLHCSILQCATEDATYYLLAALGNLAKNLGSWPVTQFVETTDQCIEFLEHAGLPRPTGGGTNT
jgi:hypothetical protein